VVRFQDGGYNCGEGMDVVVEDEAVTRREPIP